MAQTPCRCQHRQSPTLSFSCRQRQLNRNVVAISSQQQHLHRRCASSQRQQRKFHHSTVTSAGTRDMQLAPEQAALVAVEVEQGPNNSRRVYAGVDIAAPWSSVWNALTDYEGLGDFIPGLAKNECLARRREGARLLQIGEQSLAMGLKFRARVVLDIEEHPSGIAQDLISDEAVDDGCFPGPRSPAAAGVAHDISFVLHEGDFQAFRGVWRIQQQAAAEDNSPATRLSYALFVRPQKWLPVGLIQSRIESEVAANLAAVRAYTERTP